MSTPTLKEAIDKIWKIEGEWRLITLGKGYFNIQFSNNSEYDRIFKKRSWQMEFWLFRLQRWTPLFNPCKLASPLVNVWVHIYEIPQEYFHEHIIEAIVSVLGTVVSMDQRTKEGTMCHYARVVGHYSIASVGYETHSEFCSYCQVVGYSINVCRSKDRDRQNDGKDNKDNITHPPQDQSGANNGKKWTKKDNPTNNPTSTNPPVRNDTPAVELGDRHPRFELFPYFSTTTGAMQVSGFKLPHNQNNHNVETSLHVNNPTMGQDHNGCQGDTI